VAPIQFTFPSGSFRVATEWDFELDHLSHYGVGLATPAVGFEFVEPSASVPAIHPITAVLIAALMMVVGAAALGRARRAA